MSNDAFLKGECRHCGGRLEFPAEAAGQTAACPHCGQLTELPPAALRAKTRRFPIALLAAGLTLLAAAATAVFSFRGHNQPVQIPTTTFPVLPPPAPIATHPPKPAVPELRPGEEQTNNFDISPVTLEKTPGSSLVYVTGRVRNLADHQRFGVKVEFALLDAQNRTIGTATDYQPVIDTNADWEFKAMIMESKTVSARFSRILEDQ